MDARGVELSSQILRWIALPYFIFASLLARDEIAAHRLKR